MAIDSPVDAVEKQFPEHSDTRLDLVLSAGELTLPFATPLLEFVKLITGHFSSSGREERMRAFLALLRDQEKLLDTLGNRYDKLQVRVEELAEALEVAAWADANAPNDSKRDRYLKILGNAARSEDRIQDLAAFIHDVEVLGEEDIEVLKVLNLVMNKPSDTALATHGKFHPSHFIQRREELALQIAQALGQPTYSPNNAIPFSHEEGYSICARLQGFGLAHEVQLSAREVPVGDYCFRPSKRGLMLLRLIGEAVPHWHNYFPLKPKPSATSPT